MIGSGVLALPWSVAQLGWVGGPVTLIGFSFVTFYTSILLSDGYRHPLPGIGKRNCTYIGVVKSYLGIARDTLFSNITSEFISFSISESEASLV